MPKIVDVADKTRVIVAAAQQEFARQGFSATTVAAVAGRARIGKGTVYEYFASKDHLFLAVVETFYGQFSGHVEEALRGAGAPAAEQALGAVVRAYGARYEQSLPLLTAMAEFFGACRSAELRERFRALTETFYTEARRRFGHILEEGRRAGAFRADLDPAALAAGLLGALEGLWLQSWFNPAHRLLPALDATLRTVQLGLGSDRLAPPPTPPGPGGSRDPSPDRTPPVPGQVTAP